jgi:hypothetical protein
MNIQAEKIELIRLITDIKSEQVLKKIKDVLTSAIATDETERILSNPVMAKRLKESRKQINEGKGIKISLDDITIVR